MDAENKDEKISTSSHVPDLAKEIPGANHSANPVHVAVAGGPPPDTDESGAQDISLENLDALLGDSDPDFVAQMTELGSKINNDDVQISGSVPAPSFIGLENLQEKATGRFARVKNAWRALSNKFGRYASRASKASQDTGTHALNEAMGQVHELSATSKNVLKKYKKRDWKLIFLFCFTLFTMGFAFRAVKPLLDHWLKGDFFANFEKVADSITDEPPGAKVRSFRDPLEEFNFIVQYERTIVNLKSSMNSTSNPMSTFVIYVEGTSRETAVELKDRQMEIRDICQRVAEGMTYDEFVSAEGKRRFKNLVRKEVNEILNSGHLRAIYFDTVIVKP